MDISELKVKHIEGATFDWHKPTVDIYDEKLNEKIYKEILESCRKEEDEGEADNERQ